VTEDPPNAQSFPCPASESETTWTHANRFTGSLHSITFDSTQGPDALALEFAREFWDNSRGLTDDQAKGPRVTAGLYSLYAFELIVIDGAKCEDRSAPDNRISQLLRRQAATLAFLKKQEPDVKAKTVELAIGLERKTAPLRTDDDLICRNGLEEMKASLERGTQREAPNTTGHYGRTVAVTPPPDWTPKFVPPSVYRPMQEKARADVRESLLNLVR
jgi:hypothetical protein